MGLLYVFCQALVGGSYCRLLLTSLFFFVYFEHHLLVAGIPIGTLLACLFTYLPVLLDLIPQIFELWVRLLEAFKLSIESVHGIESIGLTPLLDHPGVSNWLHLRYLLRRFKLKPIFALKLVAIKQASLWCVHIYFSILLIIFYLTRLISSFLFKHQLRHLVYRGVLDFQFIVIRHFL